ncbi:MAG: hypothetical protein Q8O56_08185, partial [Solirubrobacteraceae bacterium]|nr:hypothetical protein [Solirubrobacteraceae bacterium]
RGARGATPRITVSCRLVRPRGRLQVRCSVRNASARASIVAKRGGRVVRRTKAGRTGQLTFHVPTGTGRLTVTVGGRPVRRL